MGSHLSVMPSGKPIRILITPLNWGLGHASRSLAIATAFELHADVEIHWASDGQALAFLQAERPKDTIHALPSMEIRYPRRSMVWNMLLAAPKMLRMWLAEREVVAQLHRRFVYDLIISDNRFGCRLTGVHSVILTHQVHLPLANSLAGWCGRQFNYALLRRFDEIAVPDFAAPEGLAGDMSRALPSIATRYLGPLSRFSNINFSTSGHHYVVAIVLSGPEPQRSLLEGILLDQLAQLSSIGPVLFVRGLPVQAEDKTSTIRHVSRPVPKQVKMQDFMQTQDLGEVLAKADHIIVRSGYSTVMDLQALGRKAIFIPTPGQPEQEFLAASLDAQGLGIAVTQDVLCKTGVLAQALERLQKLELESRANEPCSREFGLSPKLPSGLLDVWVATTLENLPVRSVNIL